MPCHDFPVAVEALVGLSPEAFSVDSALSLISVDHRAAASVLRTDFRFFPSLFNAGLKTCYVMSRTAWHGMTALLEGLSLAVA